MCLIHWQTFRRKHAVYLRLTSGPKHLFTKQEPEHRHDNFTLTLFNFWSHAAILPHRVSESSLKRWAVWPWNNKVRGNFRRYAILFCRAVITQVSSTAVMLPWQHRSAVYAPVVHAVELGPRRVFMGAFSRVCWSQVSQSGQHVLCYLLTQACPSLPAASVKCLYEVAALVLQLRQQLYIVHSIKLEGLV